VHLGGEIMEYVTLQELAARLKISVVSARYLARSKYLRKIKGAVLNVNLQGTKGKYEKLRIRFDAAVHVFEAYPGVWL